MKKIVIPVLIFILSVLLGVFVQNKFYKKVKIDNPNVNHNYFVLDHSKFNEKKSLYLNNIKSTDIVGKDEGQIKERFGWPQYEISYGIENSVGKKRVYIFLDSELSNNNSNALYIFFDNNKAVNFKNDKFTEMIYPKTSKEIIDQLELNKDLK